jgi:hypothetical protein
MSVTKTLLSSTKSPILIDELLKMVSEQSGKPPEAVARELYSLVELGKVQLIEPDTPQGLFDYLKRPYGAWFSAIILFVVLTLCSIFLIPQYPPYIYIRYISGALFVLYLPGYALIEALYSKADELDQLERLALSIGLSLALVPLVGLVLNYTPWGIRLVPILISLIALTVALSVVAAHRKLSYVKLGAMSRRLP